MSKPSALLNAYKNRVSLGELHDDAAQRDALAHLERLLLELCSPQKSTGILGWFSARKPPAPPRGVYVWGAVGRGKSMLMDLFFAQATLEKKRRMHFHAFMQEVHRRMHDHRKHGRDPVTTLVQEIAAETRLLCFDELQAPDVTDATLLYRLFDGLVGAGVVLVSTSNRPPAQLYTGGVHAERFQPFTRLLENHMEVITLESPTDYRQMQRRSIEHVYFTPWGTAADHALAEALARLCPQSQAVQETLFVHGRALSFSLYPPGVGVFSFDELCGKPLGAADYLALAKRLDVLVLQGIPKLSVEKRNEARRFITLIDALYEDKVLFLCTAEAEPERLYPTGDGSFEFARTASRLKEMQSQRYVQAAR